MCKTIQERDLIQDGDVDAMGWGSIRGRREGKGAILSWRDTVPAASERSL